MAPRVLPWMLVLAAAAMLPGCGRHATTQAAEPEDAPEERMPLPPAELGLPPNPIDATDSRTQLISVPPPPFSEGVFPCMSECHADLDPDPTVRPMREKHRKIKLEHDEENRWCLDCHDMADRDQLHLASGKLVSFEKSYLLCGQCHGEKLRDWKAGAHGKRTGMWNGEKQYLLCAHCHNPHSPKFKPLGPEPPPVRPEEIR